MNKYFKQATKGITQNKSRTVLTALGIIIGIGTVVMVLSIGEGFKSYINAQIEVYGTNLVTIETVVPASTKQIDANSNTEANIQNSSANNAIPITTFKNRDIEDIRKVPNVKNAYGAVLGQEKVSYKGISKNLFIFGSDAQRFEIDKSVIVSGRAFTEEENRSLAQVAILGHKVAVDLFGENNPIGELIRIGNYNLEVIGVYEEKGGLASNEDDQVFIPLTTLQKKYLGIDYLFYGIAELYDNDIAVTTTLDIEDTLRRNHNIDDPAKDDFAVRTQDENLETFSTILNALTYLLIAIALISLVVGGVGVMNIMYVVVTERIGEIGLKKALGATNKDILLEFLLEAVLLTLIGGFVGIIGGAFLSYIISKVAQSFGFSWDFIIPIYSILLATSISTLVGVIFGVFPAKSASKLDPIQALNKE